MARLPSTPWLQALRWFGHRDLIPYGVRDRLIRHFLNPDAGHDRDFSVPFFGMRYRGNLDSYIDWVVFFFGAYEKGIQFFLRDTATRLFSGRAVFIDIGANIGQHSLFMAPHVAVVHAFEPYEPVRAKLLQKVADNGLSNIVLHPVGLADGDEELPFYAPGGRNTGIGTFRADAADDADKRAFGPLPVVRGDGYFRRAGIPRADLVKMDIEGFELPALRGLRQTFEASRPVVVMEYSAETRDRLDGGDELARLLPPDYALFGLAGKPHHYRLGAFDATRAPATVVCVPDQALSRIPRRGP
jgi:FkbM family methyltransferase